MSEDEAPERPEITRARVLKWAIPACLGVLVHLVTVAMGWEPWFGYAAVIAGALGSLMYVGHELGIGGG